MGFKSRFECDHIFNISDGAPGVRGAEPQEARWVEGTVR